MPHYPTTATGIGNVTSSALPFPDADLNLELALELSDPLFHPQHAKASRPLRIKPASVVFDAQKE